MEYEIPFTNGQSIDTSDPSGSLQNAAESVLAFSTLFGVTAAAGYLYSRAKAGAGVEGDTSLPVVGN